MITGTVSIEAREARVRLLVRGVEGRAAEIDFVVDTGFTEELSLPQAMIDALGLPLESSDKIMLSDGSIVSCPLHRGMVVWDGAERPLFVQASEGTPLLGMGLLLDHLLTLPVVANGVAVIAALP